LWNPSVALLDSSEIPFVNAPAYQHLRLYVDAQYTSPYAMSVFVALREKGLDFDIVTLDLAAGAQHSLDYAGISLTHRVPTLIDGEFALSESSAITEYLDERFPGPRLYPQGMLARAKARQLQAWLRSDLMSIRAERSTEVIFYGPNSVPLSAAAIAASDRLFSAIDAILPAGAENLFGAWSIVDTDLALMLNRLAMNGDTVPKRLDDYARRQWHRPSVQGWTRMDRPPRG
jgi:glutathione S-transferase